MNILLEVEAASINRRRFGAFSSKNTNGEVRRDFILEALAAYMFALGD